MLWAFFALAMAEMLAVHLFVVLKWPGLAWPVTGLTALSLVWLIGWIRSWVRLPHELVDGQLHLHMGSLRHVAVPVAQVAAVLVAAGLVAAELVAVAHILAIELAEQVLVRMA